MEREKMKNYEREYFEFYSASQEAPQYQSQPMNFQNSQRADYEGAHGSQQCYDHPPSSQQINDFQAHPGFNSQAPHSQGYSEFSDPSTISGSQVHGPSQNQRQPMQNVTNAYQPRMHKPQFPASFPQQKRPAPYNIPSQAPFQSKSPYDQHHSQPQHNYHQPAANFHSHSQHANPYHNQNGFHQRAPNPSQYQPPPNYHQPQHSQQPHVHVTAPRHHPQVNLHEKFDELVSKSKRNSQGRPERPPTGFDFPVKNLQYQKEYGKGQWWPLADADFVVNLRIKPGSYLLIFENLPEMMCLVCKLNDMIHYYIEEDFLYIVQKSTKKYLRFEFIDFGARGVFLQYAYGFLTQLKEDILKIDDSDLTARKIAADRRERILKLKEEEKISKERLEMSFDEHNSPIRPRASTLETPKRSSPDLKRQSSLGEVNNHVKSQEHSFDLSDQQLDIDVDAGPASSSLPPPLKTKKKTKPKKKSSSQEEKPSKTPEVDEDPFSIASILSRPKRKSNETTMLSMQIDIGQQKEILERSKKKLKERKSSQKRKKKAEQDEEENKNERDEGELPPKEHFKVDETTAVLLQEFEETVLNATEWSEEKEGYREFMIDYKQMEEIQLGKYGIKNRTFWGLNLYRKELTGDREWKALSKPGRRIKMEMQIQVKRVQFFLEDTVEIFAGLHGEIQAAFYGRSIYLVSAEDRSFLRFEFDTHDDPNAMKRFFNLGSSFILSRTKDNSLKEKPSNENSSPPKRPYSKEEPTKHSIQEPQTSSVRKPKFFVINLYKLEKVKEKQDRLTGVWERIAPKNKPVGVSFNDNGIEFILQPYAENENFTIKQDDECFFKRISRSDQTTTTITRWLYLQNYTSKAGFRFRYEGEFDKIHNAFKKILQKKFERKGLKVCKSRPNIPKPTEYHQTQSTPSSNPPIVHKKTKNEAAESQLSSSFQKENVERSTDKTPLNRDPSKKKRSREQIIMDKKNNLERKVNSWSKRLNEVLEAQETAFSKRESINSQPRSQIRQRSSTLELKKAENCKMKRQNSNSMADLDKLNQKFDVKQPLRKRRNTENKENYHQVPTSSTAIPEMDTSTSQFDDRKSERATTCHMDIPTQVFKDNSLDNRLDFLRDVLHEQQNDAEYPVAPLLSNGRGRNQQQNEQQSRSSFHQAKKRSLRDFSPPGNDKNFY
ncbi:Oidioi.mRNA.OKI2018_I69.chr1.g3048.t1.cds [Oikopleura dioica]|uniref:Oidioi.mRNA.OKI2018_I69.chr1.g3048.t1.cds n=1 Tax=Oikopleura dioica TaxID=34765 RepID=A0ABN7SYE1_OIKDI|nr:Oidioi.mRNA.OKI2018_I69.chr1.g3048.t1.cds [Oikopleura dioica]